MTKSIPILMYHSIGRSLFSDKMAIPRDLFRKQMQFLKKNFQVISLEECVRQQLRQSPTGRHVAITFDDGYLDNYMEAFPCLKALGLPATFFISVSQVGHEGFVNWEMLKDMQQTSGFEIGSHGLEHDPLKDISKEKARNSIFESKAVLEDYLSREVKGFSYPSGSFNDEVLSLVEQAGYRYACAASHLHNRKYESNPYTVRRIKISETSASNFMFVFRLSGFYNVFRKP